MAKGKANPTHRNHRYGKLRHTKMQTVPIDKKKSMTDNWFPIVRTPICKSAGCTIYFDERDKAQYHKENPNYPISLK